MHPLGSRITLYCSLGDIKKVWIKAKKNLLTRACVLTDKCGLCRNFLLAENVYCRLVTGVGKCICLLQNEDSLESSIYIDGDG